MFCSSATRRTHFAHYDGRKCFLVLTGDSFVSWQTILRWNCDTLLFHGGCQHVMHYKSIRMWSGFCQLIAEVDKRRSEIGLHFPEGRNKLPSGDEPSKIQHLKRWQGPIGECHLSFMYLFLFLHIGVSCHVSKGLYLEHWQTTSRWWNWCFPWYRAGSPPRRHKSLFLYK